MKYIKPVDINTPTAPQVQCVCEQRLGLPVSALAKSEQLEQYRSAEGTQ